MRNGDLTGLTIEHDPTRSSYELAPHLVRFDGGLYGGGALAATAEAFEAATGRPTLWVTTQFVATAGRGASIDQVVEVEAEGRNVCQLGLRATSEGRLLYSAVGATANPRGGDTGRLAATGPTMPAVAPPTEGGDLPAPDSADPEFSHATVTDLRPVAPAVDPATGEPPHGHTAIWARLEGITKHTAASLGFMADMVPLGVMTMAGVPGAGTSLDNSLRVGRLVDTEWVLLDIRAHLAHEGYGYGIAHIWSADGVLMGTASQSAVLRSFEEIM